MAGSITTADTLEQVEFRQEAVFSWRFYTQLREGSTDTQAASRASLKEHEGMKTYRKRKNIVISHTSNRVKLHPWLPQKLLVHTVLQDRRKNSHLTSSPPDLQPPQPQALSAARVSAVKEEKGDSARSRALQQLPAQLGSHRGRTSASPGHRSRTGRTRLRSREAKKGSSRR